jgi:hypothetical protein
MEEWERNVSAKLRNQNHREVSTPSVQNKGWKYVSTTGEHIDLKIDSNYV